MVMPPSGLLLYGLFGISLGFFLVVVVVFLYEVEYDSFKVCKKLCWNVDGDCIETIDCFW